MAKDPVTTESTETLPPADPRRDLMDAINAKCSRLNAMCYAMRKTSARLETLRNEATGGNIANLDDLLAAQAEYTLAERGIYDLINEIERDTQNWNARHYSLSERIYVSHTREGLPIRVDKTTKLPIWGI